MQSLRKAFLENLGQTSSAPMLLEIVRAEGVWLYGNSGESYIDLISGVSVSNTGHSNTYVTSAIRQQLDSYMHLMVYGEYVQSTQVLFAEKIVSLLPESLNTIFFVNSGSEAVEGALKLARRFTGRKEIVSFANAYHGSTMGAMSVQGSDKYTAPFAPLIPGVIRSEYNNTAVQNLITENTACVIAEPIQAEAGVILPDHGFLELLRSRCNETGTLLIFDECQTGLGRTGRNFCFEHYQVVPDILILAKALGGGMPLGAFVAGKNIMSLLSTSPPLGHITTFGGHPVCCAAGMAAVEYSISNNLTENAVEMSWLFKRLLRHDLIKEVRGEGLLLAVELVNGGLIEKLVKNAPSYGIVVDYFLFCDNAFRIAPPLIISKNEVEIACSGLIKLLDDLS